MHCQRRPDGLKWKDKEMLLFELCALLIFTFVNICDATRWKEEIMADQNRFSRLLKDLLAESEIKNYTIAQYLRYDVSYISKWTCGQMLPPEKLANRILENIAVCLVESSSPEGLEHLMQEYQAESPGELKGALQDNLLAAYHYVRRLKLDTGKSVAPQLSFYPEMKLSQYAEWMRHPVLRRVSDLDIVGVMDIFAMEPGVRCRIADGGENKHFPPGRRYENVHYSMMVDIQDPRLRSPMEISFLMELLEQNSCIDFRLYGSEQAAGRVAFVVRDEYAVCGMLTGSDHCTAVVVCEKPQESTSIYRDLYELCTPDRLLFRPITMREMVKSNQYAHAMLALRQRWVMGHITEHFVPQELFDRLLSNFDADIQREVRQAMLQAQQALQDACVQVILYSDAIYRLAMDRELDFFGRRIRLSREEALQCLRRMEEMCRDDGHGMEIRLADGRPEAVSAYSGRQCIFLSDTVSSLRLNGTENRLFLLSRLDIRSAFERGFAQFWQMPSIIRDSRRIRELIRHVSGSVPEED